MWLRPLALRLWASHLRKVAMSGTLTHSLFETVRLFWREYLAAWLYPLLLLFGGSASARLGHPVLFLWLVGFPLFFWSFWRASRPWLSKRIPYWHAVVLGVLIPFAIFVFAVNVRLAVIHLKGG